MVAGVWSLSVFMWGIMYICKRKGWFSYRVSTRWSVSYPRACLSYPRVGFVFIVYMHGCQVQANNRLQTKMMLPLVLLGLYIDVSMEVLTNDS